MNVPGRHMWRTIALALVLVAPVGCSDDENGGGEGEQGSFALVDPPRIDIVPNSQQISFIQTQINVGESTTQTIQLKNIGESALKVNSIRLEYSVPPGADDGGTPALSLAPLAYSLPVTVYQDNGATFPQAAEVGIVFHRPADSTPRTATLVIGSNSFPDTERRLEVYVETGSPQIATSPDTVDFMIVPPNEKAEEMLRILNLGDRTLNVKGYEISQDIRFGLSGEGWEIGGGVDNPRAIQLAEPVKVEPGGSIEVPVSFQSDVNTPADGNLLIFSDDPEYGLKGYSVPLVSNRNGPCLTFDPQQVDFGGKLVGQLAEVAFTITSCGTQPLEITKLGLTADSSLDFGLDWRELPDGPVKDNGGPSAENPLIIPADEVVTLWVTFVPDAVNPRDADFKPIPDEGTLHLVSNHVQSEYEVPIRGAGAEADCPQAVIRIDEGEQVVPQTILHLDGTHSYAPYGAVERWLWSVEQPDGSVENLLPGPSDPQPVFNANVVGIYVFKLDVWDEFDTKSCETAQMTVIVQPDKAIHVELTWVTPTDDDESDTLGTDLDLHFVHPNAKDGPDLDEDGEPDPWFDEEWDCFWHNNKPNWATFNPDADDDPSLDRDDTDGGGPENLNLGTPEDMTSYHIGVHYWDDHGFGDVEATIRVFWYAEEIYVREGIAMKERDMWCVGDLAWTIEGERPEVIPCAEEGEHIVPGYHNPFFFQP